DVQGLEDRLHHRLLIGGVVDRKVTAEPDPLTEAPQDSRRDRVEGAGPDLRDIAARQGRVLRAEICDRLAHLAGRLVGEGHRPDPPGRNSLSQQRGHALREQARLAGPGPRENQKRPAAVLDTRTLARVEAHGAVISRLAESQSRRAALKKGGVGIGGAIFLWYAARACGPTPKPRSVDGRVRAPGVRRQTVVASWSRC